MRIFLRSFYYQTLSIGLNWSLIYYIKPICYTSNYWYFYNLPIWNVMKLVHMPLKDLINCRTVFYKKLRLVQNRCIFWTNFLFYLFLTICILRLTWPYRKSEKVSHNFYTLLRNSFYNTITPQFFSYIHFDIHIYIVHIVHIIHTYIHIRIYIHVDLICEEKTWWKSVGGGESKGEKLSLKWKKGLNEAFHPQ